MIFYQVPDYHNFSAAENISNNWDGDNYAAARYPLLGEQYMTVNDGILESLEKEYADKHIAMHIRSTRPKKE